MRTRHLLPLTQWLQLLMAVLLLAGPLAARAADDFLDPEVAFKLAARQLDARTVEVIFTIAPGYYLYREQFKFAATGATLGAPVLPPGHIKFDETFQKNVETYRDAVRISVPVRQAAAKFQLLVTNQGCADKGLCYPPQHRNIEVSLAGFGGDGSARVLAASVGPLGVGASTESANTPPASTAQARPAYAADDAGIDGALRSGRVWRRCFGARAEVLARGEVIWVSASVRGCSPEPAGPARESGGFRSCTCRCCWRRTLSEGRR